MCAKFEAFQKNNTMKTTIRLFCCTLLFLWANAPLAYTQTGEDQPVEALEAVPEDMPVDMGTDEVAEYEDSEFKTYSKQEILGLNQNKTELRAIPSNQWSEATASLDYSGDVPEPIKQKELQKQNNRNYDGPDWNWDWDFWRGFFKVLAIIVFLSLAGWVIYNFVQTPPNSLIRAQDGTEITMDNLEQYIQETDLERFLRMALENDNYQQAVRVYYLQVIKQLSERGAIQWSREKTNRAYIREMRDHPKAGAFRALTRTYEAVWYGNGELTSETYPPIAEAMQRFLKG
jgi:hypothetical protein